MDVGLICRAIQSFRLGRMPGQLVIQLTDRCNARCPQCGMRVTNRFPRSRLPVAEVKKIIDAAAKNRVQALSFTGGEPFLLLDELLELIDYADRAGIPLIRTGTNGFLCQDPDAPGFGDRIRRIARRLAATRLRNFWISIDSADAATHERLRGLPGVIRGVAKALPLFHEAGIYPSANLGINRYAGQEPLLFDWLPAGAEVPPEKAELYQARLRVNLREFFAFVLQLGFSMVNLCYPMSEAQTEGRAVYAATSRERMVRFSRSEKHLLFKTLLEVIPEFRPRLRIFTPLSSLYALTRQYGGKGAAPYPCRGGIDFLFIDAASGDTFPCGYRGNETLGKYWQMPAPFRPPAVPATCIRCDWECFRDPSELMGPLLDLAGHPLRLAGRMLGDREYLRYWLKDIRYYQACHWFDSRRPGFAPFGFIKL